MVHEENEVWFQVDKMYPMVYFFTVCFSVLVTPSGFFRSCKGLRQRGGREREQGSVCSPLEHDCPFSMKMLG